MATPTDSSTLRKLADLVRSAGDPVTADALVVQPDAGAARTPDTEALSTVVDLKRKGVRLDSRGAHSDAEHYLAQALRLAERALGPGHADLVEHLNDLARCQFNGGEFAKAIDSYRRLLHLLEQDHESRHPLYSAVQVCIERCRFSLRMAQESRRLQEHLTKMLGSVAGMESSASVAEEERLREAAQRLFARGRVQWGAALLARRFALKVSRGEPQDEATLSDLRGYAIALWEGGQKRAAAKAFQALVSASNQCAPPRDGGAGLQQALSDWSSCLAALGEHRSAQETRALAENVGGSQS